MALMDLAYDKGADGLLYPVIGMPPDQTEELLNLGKYGRMALEYLRENRHERYMMLMATGKMAARMREVDGEADDLIDMISDDYLKKHPPTDPLDTMETWQLREQAMRVAEEVVINQVVNRYH